MGRVARIRALPAMPPNVRWLVELGRELTARRYRARPVRTRFAAVDFNPDVVNLADREGLDLSAALARVHGRNVGRGRYGLRQCCDSAATEARSCCEEGANDSRTIRERFANGRGGRDEHYKEV